MKVIDFARARIAWTTHDGSHGLWRVVAAARREHGEAWYLAAGVMAGDVYGQGRLPLQPSYSFQFATSRERHVIFREAVQPPGLQDTDAPHSEAFSSVAVDAPEVEAEAVSIDRLVMQRSWPLTAQVVFTPPGGARWTLDFPVKHINLRDEPSAFQVETGITIVPRDLLDIAGATSVGGLQLAFVFFNRIDRIDLLAYGPADGAAGSRRGFAHFARLEGIEAGLFAT